MWQSFLPRAYRTKSWTKHIAEVTPWPRKGEKPRVPKNETGKEQDTSALWRCAFFTLEKLCWGSLQWCKEDWKLPQTGSRRFGLFSCDADWHSSGRNRFIPSASHSGSEERQRTRMPCTTLGSMIYRQPILTSASKVFMSSIIVCTLMSVTTPTEQGKGTIHGLTFCVPDLFSFLWELSNTILLLLFWGQLGFGFDSLVSSL